MANKSPLRYPGGKQRAAEKIADRFAGCNRVASLFLGGGAVELELADRGADVVTTDLFRPLASFWLQLKEDCKPLAERSRQELHLDKDRFRTLQGELRGMADKPAPSLEEAWRFFVLNRASFSGTTLAGGMSKGQRFTSSSIDRLCDVSLDRVEVIYGDYFDALMTQPRFAECDAIYADPPYALERGGKLYGDKGDLHINFDHALFAERMKPFCSQDSVPVTISYNDSPLVRELFDGWEIEPISWAYGMNTSKKSNEILITNRRWADDN
jgi:DNA adenine methylase